MLDKEIGSNFCETIVVTEKYLEDGNETFFFDSGRSAINAILQCLKGKRLKVILPIYTCESVIYPFVQHDCEIQYYQVNRNFEIIEDEFTALIETFAPDIVYMHSYFGFDTLNNIKDKINNLQDAILIEDITHSMLTNYRHVNVDFYVGSIRKWCSLPDGGVLKVLSDKACNIFEERSDYLENSSFVNLRTKAQREKELYFMRQDEGAVKDFIGLFDESEEILEKQDIPYTMSQYSRERLYSVDWDAIKESRNINYKCLVSLIKNLEEVEVIIPDIDNDVVPLYCPIYVKNKRNELRIYARRQNIMLPVIWPIPPMLDKCLTEECEWIYNHILALPCDQRYSVEDMEKIYRVMEEFFIKERG